MTRIDIISDPICPWCYIGKSRFERALEARPGHDFKIEWHPYQLNPDMPAEGMDRRDYLETKFGGKQGAIEVYGQIARAAQESGVNINFELIERTPDTTDAHRLIHWAGLEGVQSLVVDTLFKAYFCDGLDISKPAVLIDIAKSAGIDPVMIKKLLALDVDRDGIRKRARYAREKGVRGVPCFIVDDHYIVQGAQPEEMWLGVIDEIASATKSTAT